MALSSKTPATQPRASPNSDLQAVYAQGQLLQRQGEELERRRQALTAALADVKRAQQSITAITTNDSFLASVGSRVLVPVKPERKTVLLEVGAGVIVEQNADDANHTLDARAAQMQHAIAVLEENLETIGAQLQQLNERAQQLQQP